MRFQVNNGWLIGATLIPAATIIDIADKQAHELSEWERLAKGRVPPIDITILDADCALVMHRNYHPDFHHRLNLHLDDYNREVFEQLMEMEEAALERLWPRGNG